MSRLRARFDRDVDPLMRRVSSSLAIDLEMAEEDIEGSLAHARMLAETGIISPADGDAIRSGLERIRDELRTGTWQPDPDHEDIHMAVEERLVELVGDPGKRLHTARSRNDQVATDMRLWLKRRLHQLDQALVDLITTLLDRIDADGQTLIPGYTHLQRGQPILLGHHLLAHAWAFTRDRERLAGALSRTDRCPLGACAMAGTGHPIDRHRTAELLGFATVLDNAMDAVATRDHLQEAAATCAIITTNLSRLAEETVLWSSAEFRLLRLGESHATGSSIMPQKRNPDAAELVRGKTGRVLGHLQALLVMVKGLPMAYNRDLQEERAPLFDCLAQTIDSVRLTAAMWRDAEVNHHRFEQELYGDFALATELADALVNEGVPFREAHEAVGKMVRWCEEQGGGLELLDGGRGKRFHDALPDHLGDLLDPRAAAQRRSSPGGTAWGEVQRQVAVLRESMAAEGLEEPSPTGSADDGRACQV